MSDLVDLDAQPTDVISRAAGIVSPWLAEEYQLLPIELAPDLVRVAVLDAAREDGALLIGALTRARVELVVTTADSLMRAQKRVYGKTLALDTVNDLKRIAAPRFNEHDARAAARSPRVFITGIDDSSVSIGDVAEHTWTAESEIHRPSPRDSSPQLEQTSVPLPPSLRMVPSHSPQVKRRIRRRQTPKIRFTVLLALLAIVMIVFVDINSSRQTPLNYFLSVVWSMYAPLAAVGVMGAGHLSLRRRPNRDVLVNTTRSVPSAEPYNCPKRRQKLARSYFRGRTDRLLIVTLPTLLRPENLPALQRVLLSLLIHLPRHFDRFHVDVVTEGNVDEGALRQWLQDLSQRSAPIRILNVPPSYATANNARFKARANQYAMAARRAAGENTSTTYIYHLDDDTHIGEDTAASLAEFIELDGNRFLLAQGILAFPHYLTPSRFCRLADSIRPADDLTRFAFFTGALGTPLGGLHGEHLIVRADVEDEIGWDFPDTVIEDAFFAIQFSTRYPGRSTMLNSYSYGASPASIRDLVRQRRRWIEGLLRLACNRRLPTTAKLPLLYSILTWSLAPVQFVGLALLVSYCSGIDNTSPVSPWFLPLWSVSLAYVFWQYFEGLRVNLSASARPRAFPWLAMLLVPAIYIITAVESFAAMLGVMRFMGIGRQKRSEVIAKPI